MSLKLNIHLEKRHIRWILLAVGLIALLLVGIWGLRVYRATRSLLSRLPQAQEIMAQGPMEADPQAIGALVHGVREDFVVLKRQVGWLAPLGSLFRWVPKVGPLLDDAPALLTLGDVLTELGVMLWEDAAPSVGAIQSGVPVTEVLGDLLPPVVADAPEARLLVARAKDAFAEIEVGAVPERFQGYFDMLGKALPLLYDGLNWVEVAPMLLGLDEERVYLVLALNDDELRPSGGFITGVGEVHISSGRITSMEFMDSYKADDFSLPYPDPPEPLRWFMGIDLWVFRDSNWSPDFPTAARQAIELYRPGYSVNIDGVVAVNQYAARHLLDALGPLKIEGADEPITGATLLDYIYHSWAPDEGESLGGWWKDRKAFMGVLAEAAMARLNTGKVDVFALAEEAQRMLAQKHLLLYFEDDTAASLLADYGWDGAIPEAKADFLMVVESNMGFNKASSKIQRAFRYEVDLRQSPPLADLTLVYTHTAQAQVTCNLKPRYEEEYTQMQNRCYWAYLRVYTPQDIHLLDASRHPIPARAVAAGDRWPGVAHVEPAPEGQWDVLTQAFLLAPRAQTEVHFSYTLPQQLLHQLSDEESVYRLVWAKQAGLPAVPVRVVLHLPQNAVSLSALLLQAEQNSLNEQHSEDEYMSLRPSSASDDGVLVYDIHMEADWLLEVRYREEELP